MANAQKGRITCVDLDDDRARALFSDALPLAKRLGDLLPYPELSFRRRGLVLHFVSREDFPSVA